MTGTSGRESSIYRTRSRAHDTPPFNMGRQPQRGNKKKEKKDRVKRTRVGQKF